MTDLNKLRSEFEATPEIKAILEVMTVKFVAGFYVSVGFGIEIYTPYNALLNFAWDLWQEKAKAQAVPEGYVLLPRVPTEKMFQAYERSSVAPMSTLSKTGYKAMVEASESGAEG